MLRCPGTGTFIPKLETIPQDFLSLKYDVKVLERVDTANKVFLIPALPCIPTSTRKNSHRREFQTVLAVHVKMGVYSSKNPKTGKYSIHPNVLHTLVVPSLYKIKWSVFSFDLIINKMV